MATALKIIVAVLILSFLGYEVYSLVKKIRAVALKKKNKQNNNNNKEAK